MGLRQAATRTCLRDMIPQTPFFASRLRSDSFLRIAYLSDVVSTSVGCGMTISIVISLPLRSIFISTVSPGVCFALMAFRSSAQVTVSPSNSTMMSPLVRPARYAALISDTSRT